ncbi:MAG TPA: hypothetical protein VE912_01320 [Bacteroidales bacterium]|nr:hypothetical protein [Bacteroidales bacterium]
MKTTVKLSVMLLAMVFIFSCSKTEDNKTITGPPSSNLYMAIPFCANLTGECTILDTDNVPCQDEGYGCYTEIVACGNCSELGNISTTMKYCSCGPDDETIPGSDSKYEGGAYVLETANGNLLFLTSNGGSVIEGRTKDHPDLVKSYWQEKMQIVGGTGKYEGATGEINVNGYYSSMDQYTHHEWTGTVYVPRDREKLDAEPSRR